MGPCNLSGPASLKTQVKSDRELSFDSWSAVFVKLITYVKPVSECSPSTQRNDWCLCLVWTCAGGTGRETEKTRQIRTPFYFVSTAPPEESEDKWARSLVVYVCVYPLHTPPGHTQLQCVVQSAIHFPPIQNSIFLLFLSQEFKISQWSWPKLDQDPPSPYDSCVCTEVEMPTELTMAHPQLLQPGMLHQSSWACPLYFVITTVEMKRPDEVISLAPAWVGQFPAGLFLTLPLFSLALIIVYISTAFFILKALYKH